MTTTKSSTRASVAVIVADLLVLQSRLELPALEDLYAMSSNGIVTLNLFSADAQVIWADALEIPAAERSIHRYTDRTPIHTAYAERQGWSVHVKYDGPDQPGETLPAETVAVLERVGEQPAAPVFEPGELDGIAAGTPTPVVAQPAVNRRFDKDGDLWLHESDGRWRMYEDGEPSCITRDELAQVEFAFGPLINPDEPIAPPAADPVAVASQQLRETTNGDEFAAAFGGFMGALGQAAEHEQGLHDDCDPATCGDAAQAQAEERAEQAAAAAEVTR